MRSFTVITTAANKTMAPVHHRMPAVLFPEDWDEWLRPGPLRTGRLADLLVPAPEEALVAYRVGSGVNKSANDGPELIEPTVVPQQSTLSILWVRALDPAEFELSELEPDHLALGQLVGTPGLGQLAHDLQPSS